MAILLPMKLRTFATGCILCTTIITSCKSVVSQKSQNLSKISYTQAVEKTQALAELLGTYKQKNGRFPQNASELFRSDRRADAVLLYTEKYPPGTYCFLPEGFLKDPLGGGTSIIAFTTDSIPTRDGTHGRFVIDSNLVTLFMGEAAFNLLLNPQLKSFDYWEESKKDVVLPD
jgi:hypothetical protein